MNDQNIFFSAMIPAAIPNHSEGRKIYSMFDHSEAVAYGERTFDAGITTLPNSHQNTLADMIQSQEAFYATSGTFPETARCIAVPPHAILRSQPSNSVNVPNSSHAGKAQKTSASSHRRNSSRLNVRDLSKVTTRESSACWRCRKYKKPVSVTLLTYPSLAQLLTTWSQCRGEPICTSCLNSGFRVWPSELGCRRERLHTLTDCFVPGD